MNQLNGDWVLTRAEMAGRSVESGFEANKLRPRTSGVNRLDLPQPETGARLRALHAGSWSDRADDATRCKL